MRNRRQVSALRRISTVALTLIIIASGMLAPTYTLAVVDPVKAEKLQNSNDTDQPEEEAGEENNTESVAEYQEIEISTADELSEIVNYCSLDTWSRDKYIKLTANIHLAETDFVPFATFGGILDGNGYTVDGLNLKGDESYLGFISKLQPSGVVKNIVIKGNVTPAGKQFVVGGIVGDNFGSIENCTFEGLVKGNDYTGAIVGYNEEYGTIFSCKSKGNVIGQHYTGGIAGTNCGGIYQCVNEAMINTVNIDKGMSIEDINIEQYLSAIGSINDDTSEDKRVDTTNNTIDTGGIAGHSSGIIEYCTNKGDVGYERVGYNIGGIAGRQSGYLHGCTNQGYVQGRKDVGGIVGQAEPYIQLDLSESVINELTTNINALHDYVDKTLTDMGSSSNTISERLNLVQSFANNALEDTSYLSQETISFVNDMTGAGNELLNRVDYVTDEAGKDGGVIDDTSKAVQNVSDASGNLENAINDADVKSRMSESDKNRYENDRAKIEDAVKEHQESYDKVYKNNYNYYIYNDSKTSDVTKSYKDKEDDLKFYYIDTNGDEADYDIASLTVNYYAEKPDVRIYHVDGLGNKTAFPATEGEQAGYDADLIADASSDAAKKSNSFADDEFNDVARTAPDGSNMPAYSYTYSTYMSKYADDLVVIVEPYARDAAEDARPELEAAADNLSKAADSLNEAAKKSKDIITNINGREDITLPTISDSYKSHSDSLVANMKGMSEHLGYLNSEMNSSSDTVIRDMQDVNDSFNTIMLLFTDAMDGALDGEYAQKFEDESFAIAGECIDGAVANCTNIGKVTGDIDIAGIAGAMGIEYDFDLEGDMTNNQEANINSTFKTKCVLRADRNEGRITARKSYAAGVCGLQEMGTIIKSENYGRIASSTGDYVGGIVGSSNSAVKDCYSKGIMSGDEYIGGIAGYGHDIYDSYAIPSIVEYNSFAGAIAGEVDDNSTLERNYFVSDELAGVDRISYSMMAEPLSYTEFLKLEGLPTDFTKMQITFLIEDEVIGSRTLEYGHSMPENQYPEPVAEEDYYIDWDTTVVYDVTSDMELIGEPALYRTTIASELLRDNNQSVILVDGKFKASQKLDAVIDMGDNQNDEYKTVAGDTIDKNTVTEIYDVTIPQDGQQKHQFRMQLPQGVKKCKIYINLPEDKAKYQEVTTTTMGMYELFDTQGYEVRVLVVDETVPMWKYIVAAVTGVLILAIVVMVIYLKSDKRKIKKNKHQSRKEKRLKKEKAKKARKERIESRIEKAQQLLEDAKDDSPRGEA